MIPWFMTVISTIALILLAIFLYNNIEWFKTQAVGSEEWQVPLFQMHIHHLHLSMIKRSVGLFSGFSALFIGMAVCFYSMKQQSTMDLKSANLSVVLATSSPGIIAMVLGCYLITATIDSKDDFPGYPASQQTSTDKSESLTSAQEKARKLLEESQQ